MPAPVPAAPPRPSCEPVRVAGVPDMIKRLPRWVCWRYELRRKKDGTSTWTKVPIMAADPGRKAIATDPATWASFEAALAAYEANPGVLDGVGFVLGRTNEPVSYWISGIDIDDCVDAEGRIADWAAGSLRDFPTYCEISPSGRGIKIFALGTWDGDKDGAVLKGRGPDGLGTIEIYRANRYFTVTGRHVAGSPAVLESQCFLLQNIYDKAAAKTDRARGVGDLARRDRIVAARATGIAPGKPLPREALAGLPPLEKFLVQCDATGVTYNGSGTQYYVCCPVHRESNASMSVRVADDGRLLIRCHACEAPFEKVMAAVGLQKRDGFPEQGVQVAARPAVRAFRPVFFCDFAPDATVEKMTELAYKYMEALELRPEKLAELAARLGVTEASLERLGVGWRDRNPRPPAPDGTWGADRGGAWSFPERDSRYEIVGVQRRFEDPALKQQVVSGSHRGLYMPEDWDSIPGPVFIPEGASDVAAIMSIGRCAIGRPSALGGVADLARLLRGVDRRIIVLGENDKKADGRWPGKEGAEAVAAPARVALGRPVETVFPPAGYKDVRDWVASNRGCTKEG